MNGSKANPEIIPQGLPLNFTSNIKQIGAKLLTAVPPEIIQKTRIF